MAILKKEKKREKYGFWYLLAEPDLFEMVEKSGYGEREFVLFQKKRFITSLLSSLIALIPGLVLNKWFFLLGIVFAVYTWRNRYTKEKHEYQNMVFRKSVTWISFQRLVVMYMKGPTDSIYPVLQKLLTRLVDSPFKTNLQRFLIDITDDPQDVKPYITFAEYAAGGMDSAYTFMTALYNFQRFSHDNSIIDELSDVARLEMMEGIKDIRKTKEKRFYLFPTYITMLNVIPMFGFMFGMIYQVFLHHMNNI